MRKTILTGVLLMLTILATTARYVSHVEAVERDANASRRIARGVITVQAVPTDESGTQKKSSPSPVTQDARTARYSPVRKPIEQNRSETKIAATQIVSRPAASQPTWRLPMRSTSVAFAMESCERLVEDIFKGANYAKKQLVLSFIEHESACNPAAVSPKGAVGLMQVMPKTQLHMECGNMRDPAEQIRCGAKYLVYLYDTKGAHSVQHLASFYIAGPDARTSTYASQEVQSYVRKVTQSFRARMKKYQSLEIATL